MPVSTVFLGWKRHALEAAADFIARQARRDGECLDLSDLVIVLPVSRAIRRLTELLAARSGAVVLPRIVTAGSLAELAVTPELPPATESERLLAWLGALGEVSEETLFPLIRRPLSETDLGFRLPLAAKIDSIWAELTAHDLDFEAVAAKLAGDIDEERWQALSELQLAYLGALEAAGREDGFDFRRKAAASPGDFGCKLILVGCADLNPVARKLLLGSPSEVVALVQADPEESGLFDECGCLLPARWAKASLPIDPDGCIVTEKPSDQALAAIRALDDLGARFGPSNVALASAQPEILAHLQSYLESFGCKAVDASGYPFERSPSFVLLRAASRYIGSRRFADLGSLARHPHFHARLREDLGADGGSILAELDAYHEDHLPGRLEGEPPRRGGRRSRVKKILDAVDRLLAPLRGERKPLARWAGGIGEFLQAIYGELTLSLEAQLGASAFARAIWEMGDELAGTPLAEDLVLSGPEAVSFFCERIRSERVSPEPGESSLELLGWLELPLDDSDAAVICGFNEGHVPESLNDDPFLPNGLRTRLGLTDNERRYARDAYVLNAILRSRKEVRLVSGRRDSADGRLRPSRLLFACPDEDVAGRILAFYEQPAKVFSIATESSPEPARFTLFPVEPLAGPIERIPVTAFRSYLACPYRFYLRHVLGLHRSDDRSEEMDGGLFGSLLHDVLARFGREKEGHSADPAAIAKILSGLLEDEMRGRFGSSPRPAVPLQIEQARARLRRFADAQAALFLDGWEIERVEYELPQATSFLDVDGEPVRITGRIDRIDRSSRTGEWMVIDYKTGDRRQDPKAAHRRGDGWIDLQLPLYRHLLEAAGEIGKPGLAYLCIPAAAGEVGLAPASWPDADHEEAIEKAREVARAIRAGVFWPHAANAVSHDDLAVLCGAGQFFEMEGEEQ